LPGYQFFAKSLAAYELGGDYYDFIPVSPDRVAIVLADVSGKGIQAALTLAKFSSDVRHCLLTAQTPASAVEALNQVLCKTGLQERFIKLSLGLLDRLTSRLTLCSAGSLPILLRRANGQIEQIGDDIAGFPLGILPESNYQQAEVQLCPGDVIVAYSDGIVDSYSPRQGLYTSPRLIRRLSDLSGSPEAVGQAILEDYRNFLAGEPQADDFTLICFGPHPQQVQA
jgi:serine phosphatase RsbU (regulator of sigma subunit)